jgi:hypothetical protein
MKSRPTEYVENSDSENIYIYGSFRLCRRSVDNVQGFLGFVEFISANCARQARS